MAFIADPKDSYARDLHRHGSRHRYPYRDHYKLHRPTTKFVSLPPLRHALLTILLILPAIFLIPTEAAAAGVRGTGGGGGYAAGADYADGR